jgi:hypothetical protein
MLLINILKKKIMVIDAHYYDVIKVIIVIIIIIINEFKFQLKITKSIIRPGNNRRDI